MSKNAKLIMYLLILGLIIAVSAVIFTAGDKKAEETAGPGPEFNRKAMEDNYQDQFRKALSGFLNSNKLDELSAPDATAIKDKLLKFANVPAQFKGLHLEMVLALTEIEESLTSGSAELLNQGREKIKNSLSGYSWLEKDE